MKIVLDTDVVVAGIRSSLGASRILLQMLGQGRIEVLCSVALFLEYEAVLTREHHLKAAGLTMEEMQDYLSGFASLITPVKIHYLWRPMLKDPEDEMVLETAINGGSNALVTFNVADYASTLHHEAMPCIKPKECLRRIYETTL